MDKLCKMGQVTVAFRNLPSFDLWPFGEWKLNAFEVKEGIPDVVVNYKNEPIIADGELVFSEDARLCRREFYQTDDGRVIWQQLAMPQKTLQLQYVMSADGKNIHLTCDNTNTVGMAAFESLTFLIFHSMLYRDVLTFHGALVEWDGKGFFLCAPSGGGKTTHAKLWKKYKNSCIINGDRATCSKGTDGWIGFGTPWCGTSGEYIDRSVPIKAAVVLKKAEKNQVTELFGGMELQSILPHVVYPNWSMDATEKTLSLLDGFLSDIPVLLLECTKDESAAEVLSMALEKYC